MMYRPYSIRLDAPRCLLWFEVEGFWSIDTVTEFRAELVAALHPIVVAGQAFDILADLSRYLPQARAISEQMEESLVRGADLGMRRVACIVSSAVTRLQFARVAAAQDVQFFSSVDDALDWLRVAPSSQDHMVAPIYDCALCSTSSAAM